MNKDDIRSLITGALFFLGLLLIIGTYGKYEFNGYISASEFLGKIGIGLFMIVASVPVSGELPLGNKKNRR